MAWKIPDETIDSIRDRVSIVEVVSTYLTLKRAGRNHLGLCPFHSEKTPSFTVNEERGLFHCFGCGAGGSVFTFLMRMERVEFREAVEMLARRAGVTIPHLESSQGADRERERWWQMNGWAARKFSQALAGPEGEPARRYLKDRAVADDVVAAFGIGYAPPAGEWLARALGNRPEALAVAVQLGLIGRRDEGGYFDRFRGRIMFPIRDARGRVIGFGGRTIADALPKYLNSPESPVFRKGEVLYGLPEARDAMREREAAVIVEGYLDVLALAQFGVRHVVATLGTALTAAHLRALKRLTGDVTVLFDGDRAGRAAAMRAFAVCAEAGVWAKGGFLPEGDDPDSFVRRAGAEAVEEVLAKAVPLSDYYLDQVRPDPRAAVAERARAAQDVARVLVTVKEPLERDLLIRRAAEGLGVGEESMRAACAKSRRWAPPSAEPKPAEAVPAPAAETLLVETMAVDAEVARMVARGGVLDRFRDESLAACGRRLADAWEEGLGRVARLLDDLPASVAARLSGALVSPEEIGPEERMRMAQDCVARIEREARRQAEAVVRRQLREAATDGDEEKERELLERLRESTQPPREFH